MAAADKTVTRTAPSRAALWTGRVLSTLIVLFMLFDGITKVLRLSSVVSATVKFGFAADQVATVGVLALVGTILYAMPRTAVLGAVWLTAYWGGAVATNFRLHLPAGFLALPVIMGILAWGALWLRHPLLRHHVPLRKDPTR